MRIRGDFIVTDSLTVRGCARITVDGTATLGSNGVTNENMASNGISATFDLADMGALSPGSRIWFSANRLIGGVRSWTMTGIWSRQGQRVSTSIQKCGGLYSYQFVPSGTASPPDNCLSSSSSRATEDDGSFMVDETATAVGDVDESAAAFTTFDESATAVDSFEQTFAIEEEQQAVVEDQVALPVEETFAVEDEQALAVDEEVVLAVDEEAFAVEDEALAVEDEQALALDDEEAAAAFDAVLTDGDQAATDSTNTNTNTQSAATGAPAYAYVLFALAVVVLAAIIIVQVLIIKVKNAQEDVRV
jgi:hypothetical protein